MNNRDTIRYHGSILVRCHVEGCEEFLDNDDSDKCEECGEPTCEDHVRGTKTDYETGAEYHFVCPDCRDFD